ncbi:MAG TPA: sigma 54-interacting transcriptional regulator, partial [Methylomirabilota bacterium]|nr:sigma 54-interacting transcriptional regulator [Methylomirabilota bacterium]
MIEIPELLGESSGIMAVRTQLDRLLRHHTDGRRLPPILIQGETGTGKGLIARAIHRAGARREGPFVDVNCAAIPETLLEAEMFGFERGAFTDARRAKPGLLQEAHRGVIFLDEIGLLPDSLQAKLLKAIEEQVIRRLGGTRSQPIDVWILSATSEDLLARTRTRQFREDLYHRLALLTIQLPPLRDRGEDIERLAEHFLGRACADYGLSPRQLDAEARAALRAHRWPGNVRELANLMERAVLLSEVDVLTAEDLGLEVRDGRPPAATLPLEREVTSVERARVVSALEQTSWNVSRAADLLGISRNKLRYRIRRYGLQRGAPPTTGWRPLPPAAEPILPAVSPLTVPLPALRWESRRLVLLQAQLVAPGDGRPSSDTNHLVEAVVNKLRGFGGHVEELSPTGILAAFGIEPLEDTSSRAALSAIAILNTAATLRRSGREPVAVKIAIHIDQALVGRIGAVVQLDAERKRQMRGVLDDLLAAGEPDTIVLSTATARVLERRFHVAPAGDTGAFAKAYRLVGREHAGVRRRITRFVGRHAELRFLRDRLVAAIAGRGQVVGISGDPGIGKSRLLDELRRGIGESEVTYLEGRCFSYLTAIPYAPVIQMLRSNFGLTDFDSPETIGEKARCALQQVGMDPGEAAPYLLLLLGIREGSDRLDALSPEAVKTKTFQILTEMTLRGSQRRPLVLAAEDVHWVDTASEAFVTALVERIAGAPVLLVMTYRPGYRPPGTEKSYATQIALSPLSQEESLRVVHGMRDTVPESVARLILARADGNPLFLEELTRAMSEQAGDPGHGVPDTLREVLLARVDRLPEDARRLLQAASVLGREFPASLLGAMSEPDGELDAALRELTRLEFLFLRSAIDEPVYVFKHVLTQEAVRDSVEPSQRQALHAAAARALERLYGERPEQVYDSLAYHHANAGDTRKTIDYLARFAARAIRAAAHVEGAAALDEALVHSERLPDGPDRDRLRLQLILDRAYPLTFLGRFRDVLDSLGQERERIDRFRDPVLAGPYYFWLARTHGVLGDQERAVEAAHRALEEAERCDDRATIGKACYVLAYGDYWQGRPSAGVEHGRQAVSLLEGTHERFWLGLAHWVVAISHAHMGDFERGLEAMVHAEVIAEETRDPQLLCTVAWSSGMMQTGRGDYDAGIAACRRAVEISPNPVNTALARGFLGVCHLEKGEAEEAIPLLEESAERLAQFEIRQTQGWYLALLAEAHLLSGRADRAAELAAQGLQISRDARYANGVGWAQRALGRLALLRQSPAEAEARFTDALDTFGSVGARFEEARTHMALA